MGYTIYWKTKENLTREEFAKCVEAIKEIIEFKNGSYLSDCFFVYTDDCNKYNINFNGIAGEDCETFIFNSLYTDDEKKDLLTALDKGEQLGRIEFEYCKTNRLSYDRDVKTALMKIQQITNNKLDVSCDDGYHYYADRIERIEEDGSKEVWDSLDDLPEGQYEWQ